MALVTCADAGLTRKSITPPMSEGAPTRPAQIDEIVRSRCFCQKKAKHWFTYPLAVLERMPLSRVSCRMLSSSRGILYRGCQRQEWFIYGERYPGRMAFTVMYRVLNVAARVAVRWLTAALLV